MTSQLYKSFAESIAQSCLQLLFILCITALEVSQCFSESGVCIAKMASTGCPTIISRAEWKARSPKQPLEDMAGPAQYVFIHHGAGVTCKTKEDCIKQVKGYQDYHMDDHKWLDIGYNFVVGEDGNVYEARGWTAVGAHTQKYNGVGIGICVIGDFNRRVPDEPAQNTIKQLIQYGLEQGHISPGYTLKGHRDVGSTECPGKQLYKLIQSWPHYKSGIQKYT